MRKKRRLLWRRLLLEVKETGVGLPTLHRFFSGRGGMGLRPKGFSAAHQQQRGQTERRTCHQWRGVYREEDPNSPPAEVGVEALLPCSTEPLLPASGGTYIGGGVYT